MQNCARFLESSTAILQTRMKITYYSSEIFPDHVQVICGFYSLSADYAKLFIFIICIMYKKWMSRPVWVWNMEIH